MASPFRRSGLSEESDNISYQYRVGPKHHARISEARGCRGPQPSVTRAITSGQCFVFSRRPAMDGYGGTRETMGAQSSQRSYFDGTEVESDGAGRANRPAATGRSAAR